MGDGNFRHPLTDHQKFGTGDYVGGLYGCAKFGANRWNITNFNLFIYTFFHQLTYRSDAATHFYAWWLKRRGLAQGCAFWGFVDIAPHFRGEIPRKPQFWGVNRRFQAKRAKYWKFHVIETTASISTKFCTTIDTIKWSSWVVPIIAQEIQDGGRPPF